MKSIFEYNSYRSYLRDRFPPKGENRGRRKYLAEHLGCQLSLIGLVLTDRTHFSKEMLCEVAEYLRLSEKERDFFLLLGTFERAGSHKLRKVYEKQIKKIREQHRRVDDSIKSEAELPIDVQAQYYGNWLNVAIHVAVTIPERSTIERLEQLLVWPRDQIEDSVRFLVRNELIRQVGSQLFPGVRRLHLKRTSSLTPSTHMTWRLEATRHVQANRNDNLHFSATYSVSRSDYGRIRKILEDALVDCEKVVGPSQEEALMAIGVDCWKY